MVENFRGALFRAMLLGGSGVGKTTLIPDEGTGPRSHILTGTCFTVMKLKKNISVQWWELSPLEEFRSIRKRFYKGAKLAIIVFDVTNRPSFDEVEQWFSELRGGVGTNIPVILAANKTDLKEERVIEMSEGKEKAEKLDLLYFESGNHNRLEFYSFLEKVVIDMLRDHDIHP